ncbi:TetR/AcrR family transcriptional regulator [Ectobacillus sp. sgz5001026]|uniref:TetR/AcrR family transcriptional regulator n=1 Tax=Ectobacillus sp. sgz5001026 TaxID=3242473 RepID=UPI0036D20E0D
MNTRKKEIITEATKLFSQKGYLATSIQEIVERSGMSKGTFYNYFNSKEELILSCIKHHYELLNEKLNVITNQNLDEKTKFMKQLQALLEHSFEHRDFTQLQMQEQTLRENELIRQLLFKVRAQLLTWLHRRLIKVYGDRISLYALDCATILKGMLREYISYIVFDQKPVTPEEVIFFLMRRMDAIVVSFTKDEKPLLNEYLMENFLHVEALEKQECHKQIILIISRIRDVIDSLTISQKQRDKLVLSLDAIEHEFSQTQQEPREHIVQGLLLYMQKQKVLESDLQELSASVEAYF